ncbi:MAG TPA: M48 family metalloprotease [Solirubrobacteraceae bacterium]|nr:M48 family metalloprotease [Solirubrobacteraceae bacterium]
MVARRWQLPVALATAVAVAELAVLLLRPRDGVITPAEVSAGSYFTGAELARAEGFRDTQTLLYVLAVALELAVLVYAAWRPPRWLLNARRPVLAGFAAGAALSVATALVALPVGAISRQRSIDVGLTTRSWLGWLQDLALSWTIAALIAGAGAALAVVVLRRFGQRWWIPGGAIVIAFAVLLTYAQPVVLDPLFNTFQPLPAGQTRDDVLELAQKAGLDVGEVQVIDASKRTTAANAYVTGIGHTKRVVLYDTLVEDFSREETRLVVAHELGHVHYDDVPHGLLWVALVAFPGMFAVAAMTRRLAPAAARRGDASAAAAIPALAVSIAIVVPVITAISNQLSRDVEARADSYSLQLTDEPEAFIAFEKRLSVRNVSDPDPAAWKTWWLGTHPPTIERIGIGVAYERERAEARER